jgi:hypothetical protein
MSGFPLYDNLIQGLPKKDLTVAEKESFIANISKVDDDCRNLVYALIKVYHNENKDSSTDDVPYKGQKQEKEKNIYKFSWVYTNFPIKLRRLLHKFLSIHLENNEHKRSE